MWSLVNEYPTRPIQAGGDHSQRQVQANVIFGRHPKEGTTRLVLDDVETYGRSHVAEQCPQTVED